jgi:hypothetical protein
MLHTLIGVIGSFASCVVVAQRAFRAFSKVYNGRSTSSIVIQPLRFRPYTDTFPTHAHTYIYTLTSLMTQGFESACLSMFIFPYIALGSQSNQAIYSEFSSQYMGLFLVFAVGSFFFLLYPRHIGDGSWIYLLVQTFPKSLRIIGVSLGQLRSNVSYFYCKRREFHEMANCHSKSKFGYLFRKSVSCIEMTYSKSLCAVHSSYLHST